MLNSFVIGRCMVIMPKWDAGEALAADREREDHLFRRRADHEPGAHDPPRPRTNTTCRRSPTSRPAARRDRSATSSGCAGIPLGQASARLRPDRNQRGRLPQFLGQLCRQASLDRARAQALCRPCDSGRGRSRICPPGKRGEIAIRTAANIKGYWRNPEATAALFTPDGFIRTGDIGYLDEDGYLFIVDRKKDIIIRGGENISAAEVEAACYACPAVAEASRVRRARRAAGRSSGRRHPSARRQPLGEDALARLPRRPYRQVQGPGALHLLRRPRCRASAPARSTGAR